MSTITTTGVVIPAMTRARLRHVVQAAAPKPKRGYASQRPVLELVHFSDGWAATCDSYRLHAIDLGTNALDGMLLNAQALKHVLTGARKNDALVVDRDADGARVACGKRSTTIQRGFGKFPDWRALLPKGHEGDLTVPWRDELGGFEGAVKRGAVLANHTNRLSPVTLHPKGDRVVVTAGSGEVGQFEEWVPATVKGDVPPAIAFNPKYLRELAAFAEFGNEVTIHFRDALKPITVSGEGFIGLLMPVRL